MFRIAYFNRSLGRGVEAKYATLEAAQTAANLLFAKTGIIVGIEVV